ncbi:hypothetical protein FRB99_007475 [Tulasnella sp. 403]|nr:hypothetical protein FRB99_007475 [Tulasnella sp. 403]
MDAVGEYFENLRRSPVPSLGVERKNQADVRGQNLAGNVEAFYGRANGTATLPASLLTRDQSLSSDGKAWKQSLAPADIASSAAQYRPTDSLSSNLAGSIIQKQPPTPPTQDTDPIPVSTPPTVPLPVETSPAENPVSSPTTRSVTYLPPGAASPHLYRTSGYMSGNGMAGIGSGSWNATAPSRRGSSSASPSQDPTRSASRRTQQHDMPLSIPGEHASAVGRQSPRVDEPSWAPIATARPEDVMRDIPQPNPESRLDAPPSIATSPFPSSSRPAPLNQASPYPTFPSQTPEAPAIYTQRPTMDTRREQPQTRGGPRAAPVVVEEVCIECMMRDRDMADIDVTGPGVWDRESDVWYNELVRREQEEEIRARLEGIPLPAETSGRQRPRARGDRLTEENLKVWLTMNPKEPHARWQTLEAYLKSQSALLIAEAAARAQTQRESRLLDNRLRESYSQIRRSGYDVGSPTQIATSGATLSGIHVRVAASPSIPSNIGRASPPEKDVTLLENGLIVERVDLRKEERDEKVRMRRDERTDKQRRRLSSAHNDGSSVYNASIYSAPSPTFDNSSNAFLGTNQTSPYHGVPPQSAVQLSPGTARRMSTVSGVPLNPPRPHVARAPSQASVETTGTGVRRFFGYKHWGGTSQSSLAISGSMMDMHLGLDQDRRAYVSQDVPFDFSAPPSVEFGANEKQTHVVPELGNVDDRSSTVKSKKKAKGLGKLWKIVTGQKDAPETPKGNTSNHLAVDDDLSTPLAPPPPLSYLVSGRSDRAPPSRHLSSPSPSGGMSPHPRSVSAPAQSTTGVSPPTAPSSLLPSPTSNRFPWRDSASDDRRNSGPKDEPEVDEDTNVTRRTSGTADSRLQFPRNGTSSPTPSFRPYSLEKNLPPLPVDRSHSPPSARPNTMHINDELMAPRAPFRAETRRQSFGGMTNKFARQTWMAPNDSTFVPPPSIGARYDEFGGSRRSLGRFEDMRTTPGRDSSMAKREKSRSRFGLSSLFSPSKKYQSSLPPTIYLGSPSASTLAPIRAQPEVHHTRDTSASHSSFSDVGNARSTGSHNPRASFASSKKLALVVQDDDFVAYRYPSHTQTLPFQR